MVSIIPSYITRWRDSIIPNVDTSAPSNVNCANSIKRLMSWPESVIGQWACMHLWSKTSYNLKSSFFYTQVHGQFKALKRQHSFWTNLNHLVHVVLPPPSCFWWPFVLKMQSLAHKWGDVWHAKPIKMSQNAAASGKGEHCAQPKLSSPMMVGAGATTIRY